jgi:membrane protein
MVATVTRAFKKFLAENMADYAAALTYYVMMSLFPALLVGVSLLGLLGDQSLVTEAVDYARDNGAPAEVTDALRALLTKTVTAAGGAVSSALILGLAVALYGASGAFGAAGRALNHVYGAEETRGFLMHKLADIGFTILVIVLALIALVAIFLGGDLAGDLFGTIGLGDTAASVWIVARWAVAIGAVLGIYAIVFSFAPDVAARRRRIISPGALVGVAIWIVASVGFFFYVSNFGKYGATYGAFAGAVILLLWLYISTIAFLFGAELNSVVDDRGAMAGGAPGARRLGRSAEARGAGLGDRAADREADDQQDEQHDQHAADDAEDLPRGAEAAATEPAARRVDLLLGLAPEIPGDGPAQRAEHDAEDAEHERRDGAARLLLWLGRDARVHRTRSSQTPTTSAASAHGAAR